MPVSQIAVQFGCPTVWRESNPDEFLQWKFIRNTSSGQKSALSSLLQAVRRLEIHQFHQEFGPVIRIGATNRNRLWLLNAVGTTILFPITEHAVALNGNVVSHFANPRAGRGVASAAKVPSYIGLQSYPGQRAQFRSIRIS